MKYIPSINGLRAISIIIVIIKHLVENNKIESLPSILNIFQNGQLGVSIFFVLSGYLITRLLIHEQGEYGKISVLNFYKRRILRIFPAYYFLLICYFFFQLIGFLNASSVDWISAITFTKQFFRVGWLFRHLWTLSVEELFYLIFPLVFIFFHGKRNFSIIILGIILSLFPIFRITGQLLVPSVGHFNIFFRGDALLSGCFLALNYDFIKTKLLSLPLLPLMGIVGLVLYHLFSNELLDKYWVFIIVGRPGESLVDIVVITIIIVFSINSDQTVVFKILNSNVLNFIGALSYSLYLWQQLFTSPANWGIFTEYPYNLVFLFLISLFSYFLIEKPFLRLKSTWIN
jgi:peptidoglycan/LPS O-acetylase OafA/YrhL